MIHNIDDIDVHAVLVMRAVLIPPKKADSEKISLGSPVTNVVDLRQKMTEIITN